MPRAPSRSPGRAPLWRVGRRESRRAVQTWRVSLCSKLCNYLASIALFGTILAILLLGKQETCDQNPRSPRPADPRRAAGGCAHLQPGVGEARRTIAGTVLAAPAAAGAGRIHRRLRDAVAGAGDRAADSRVRR